MFIHLYIDIDIFFYFSTVNAPILLHCLLAFMFSKEKTGVILILGPYRYNVPLPLLPSSNISSFSLIFLYTLNTLCLLVDFLSFFFFLKIYLLRQRGREGKREGEKRQCLVASHATFWGSGPQPKHVPWLGIEPATLWFTGWCSIHWATQARATFWYLSYLVLSQLPDVMSVVNIWEICTDYYLKYLFCYFLTFLFFCYSPLSLPVQLLFSDIKAMVSTSQE